MNDETKDFGRPAASKVLAIAAKGSLAAVRSLVAEIDAQVARVRADGCKTLDTWLDTSRTVASIVALRWPKGLDDGMAVSSPSPVVAPAGALVAAE